MTIDSLTTANGRPKKRRGWRWFLRFLLMASVLLVPLLYWASRTTAPDLPPGVRKEVRQFVLAQRPVSVTLYYPARAHEAPLVIVAHGFTRSKRYMAGWGGQLAREGFLAAVLTQPALADHELNATVISDLAGALRDANAALKVKASARLALMGHSMGGLTSFLAANRREVDAWIGLDPVGMNDSWLAAAKNMRAPCAVLRAEPGAWNMSGNASRLVASLTAPKLDLKVRGASHLDPEFPTDVLGQIACGQADVSRRAVFERYAIAFLKLCLTNDAAAKKFISGAAADPALAEVQNTLR